MTISQLARSTLRFFSQAAVGLSRYGRTLLCWQNVYSGRLEPFPSSRSVGKVRRDSNVSNPKVDMKKMKCLIHYVCDKAKDPSVLGSIKLNKVLWYSDVISYLVFGKPITNDGYIKRQFGPVPMHVLDAIDSLVDEGAIARGTADHFGYMKKEFIAITDATTTCFTADEVRIIDDAFQKVCLENTAKSISDETHDDIWKLAEIGEVIPYQTVFASRIGELDETDIEWAHGELRDAA